MQSSLFLCVALALTSVSGCMINRFSAQRDFQKTIDVEGQTAISATTSNGEIEVSSHDQPQIELIAHLKAYGATQKDADDLLMQLDPQIESSPEVIEIKSLQPKGFVMLSVSYELRIPKNLEVVLKTGNGAVAVSSVNASVRIKTSNGKVHVTEGSGTVEADTSNGAIIFERCDGTLLASSSNGKIELKDCRLAGLSKLDTSNGAISVELAESTPIAVQAKTSNGRINCEVPMAVDGEQKKTRLTGTLFPSGQSNQAENELTIQTSNGSINIRAAEATTK